MKRKIYSDQIPGGLADEAKPEDFDSKAVEKGMEVELEHTDDSELAKEIAIDHLTEDPNYYEKLEKVESSMVIHKGAVYKESVNSGKIQTQKHKKCPEGQHWDVDTKKCEKLPTLHAKLTLMAKAASGAANYASKIADKTKHRGHHFAAARLHEIASNHHGNVIENTGNHYRYKHLADESSKAQGHHGKEFARHMRAVGVSVA